MVETTMQKQTRNTPPGPVLWEETIPGGCHWSGVIRRGVTLRLIDRDGAANAAMLIFNHEDKCERYNMPDTLKAQHTAFLTKGYVCYSDMGRVLCSVTEDTAGWHDTICGVLDDRAMREKYGERRYQTARNEMYRSGKEGFLKELARYGLSLRDFHANVNWFSKVVPDTASNLKYVAGACKPGSYVDLRFEMNCLVVLSAAPHALDPALRWAPGAVQILAWRSGVAPVDDLCRNSRPENQRGFINTERYFAA